MENKLVLQDEIYSGTMLLEGKPEFSKLENIAMFCQDNMDLWIKPVDYDQDSNLLTSELLVRNFNWRKVLSGEEDRNSFLKKELLIFYLETRFDGIVELIEETIEINSSCIDVLNKGISRRLKRDSGLLIEKAEYVRLGEESLCSPSLAPDVLLQDALSSLDALVGLEKIKKQIHDLVALIQKRGKENIPCMHMVFTGNPGTGKTEVARIFGEILAALEVLPTGEFVEVDRSDLVGQYVGHTAQKTLSLIEASVGGVLFIDEAYSLGCYASDLGAGPDGDGGRRDFGPEAIDVLVRQLEEHRDDLVCVMAGYPQEMERMLNVNPGLRDRIGIRLDFPDYSTQELVEIFDLMCKRKGYSVASDVLNEVQSFLFSTKDYSPREFGNARFVRKLVERTIFKQNLRSTDNHIELIDVLEAISDDDLSRYSASSHSVPIGFCA